jgi:hypothetical protein
MKKHLPAEAAARPCTAVAGCDATPARLFPAADNNIAILSKRF